MLKRAPFPVPAGSLDRRITVERFTVQKDAFNNPLKVWATYAKFWASKYDWVNQEILAAGEIGADITTRFRVRWSEVSAAITPKDRINYNGFYFDIVGIRELERRQGLEILTKARTDTSQT